MANLLPPGIIAQEPDKFGDLPMLDDDFMGEHSFKVGDMLDSI